jgi:hypothetical protein
MSDVPEAKFLKDKDGQIWTPRELQALAINLGNFTDVAARLGLKRHDVTKALKSLGVVSPPDYVAKMAMADPIGFREMIIDQGGFEKPAKYYGVSETHLKNLYKSLPDKKPTQEITADEIIELMGKFGSVGFVAKVLEINESTVKRICPNWKELTDPTKMKNQAVSTGRLGENYWKSIRGDQTLTCLAEVNPNYPGYDFIDKEYGKVNVKAARARKAKSIEEETWTWEICPTQEADVFALLAMTEEHKPVGIILIYREASGDLRYPPTLRCVKRSNGDYGLSVKRATNPIGIIQWWHTVPQPQVSVVDVQVVQSPTLEEVVSAPTQSEHTTVPTGSLAQIS